MATKRTLESLRAAFNPPSFNKDDKPKQFINNYYPFWNINPNQRAVIRFLPDRNENNPRQFLVEKVQHTLTINGYTRKIACLEPYGMECPICKISQAYYKAGDKINGKKYWKMRQYLGQALIIEDPIGEDDEGEPYQGKIKMIALGFQIYNIVREAIDAIICEAEDDDDITLPYDMQNGLDFIIKKTTTGDHSSYTIGTKFMTKARALTAAERAIAEEGMIDLSTLLPKPYPVEKVQAMLDAEMNGEEYHDSPEKSEAVESTTVTTSTVAAEETPPWDESTSSVDDMLAQIKARRVKK